MGISDVARYSYPKATRIATRYAITAVVMYCCRLFDTEIWHKCTTIYAKSFSLACLATLFSTPHTTKKGAHTTPSQHN